MLPVCPNLSDSNIEGQFNTLKLQVGEDPAYWLYNRFDGDFRAINEALTQIGVRVHPTPKVPKFGLKSVSTGMTGKLLRGESIPKINLNKHPINEHNNPNIWELENKLGLVSIRSFGKAKFKFYNAINRKEANDVINWITKNHLNVKVKIVPAWTENRDEVGIKLEGYPKNVDEEIAKHQAALESQAARERMEIEEETREDLIEEKEKPKISPERLEDRNSISRIMSRINQGASIKEIIDSIEDNKIFDNRSKAFVEVIKVALEKYPDLSIKTISREQAKGGLKTYAYYSNKDKIIFFINEKVNDVNDYNFFVNTVLHELVHAFTTRALYAPKTKEDIEFASKIKNLYETTLHNFKENDFEVGHEMKNEKEFLAELMSNPEFLDKVKKLKYNIWYRIVKAISDFLGLRLVTDIYDEAFQYVMEYIPSQERFTLFNRDLIEEKQVGAAESESEAKLKGAYPLRGSIDLGKRGETVKYLRNIQKEFEFVKGKGVIHKESGRAILPVKKIIEQFNLGIDKDELEDNPKLQEVIDRAGSIGTVVHGNIDKLISGGKLNIKNKLDFTSSPELRADLEKIVDKFKGEDVTIISELYVADLQKGVGGKIDMIIIDKNNKVHLYDFKSKENGFRNWGVRFDNEFDGSLKYSDKQAAHAQLTLYKHIFERITAIPVNSMTAVLIEPKVEENKVIGAKLSSEQNGLDRWNIRSREGSRIYEALKNIGAREAKHPDQLLSQFLGVEKDTRYSYYVESELKSLKYESLEFSKAEEALGNLVKGLEEQIKYANRVQSRSRAEKLEDRLRKVREQEDTMKSLEIMLQTALENVQDIDKEYLNLKTGKKQISIGKLFWWKKSVEAWDGFGDYANYLKDTIATSKDIAKDEKLKEYFENLSRRVDLLVRMSNQIKERYTSEGIAKLAKFLAPFYNRIRAEQREDLRKIYRRDKPTGVTEEQFIKEGLAARAESTEEDTQKLLMAEMRKASTDINVLGMWLDNLLDSRDPVTAAMVKAYAKTEDISHRESIKTRDKLLKIVREFEKENTDRGGTVSYQKLYDFMLEKDEKGEYTGHFIGKFMSSLFREYDEEGELSGGYMKVIQDTRHYDPDREYEYEYKGLKFKGKKAQIRKDWKDHFTTFRKSHFQSAKWGYIRALFDSQPFEEEITEKHIEWIRQNEQDIKQAYYSGEETQNLRDLANNGRIPHELADAIDDWVWKNAWEYREIKDQYKDKYENKDYIKLQDQGGTNLKFYSAIMELMNEADRMLPYSSRLGGRLPGVEKRTTEMLKDGMGIVSTTRAAIRRGFTIRPDDPEHDNFTYADEEQPFLPIHYTGRVDKELQSYDIPTIVFKYWDSANDFNNKKEILPEMELAKFVIQNRKTDPLSRRRYKILGGKSARELRANNNNLAKQVEEWFQTCVYGRPKKKQGKIFGVDVVKFTDILNKYTALNLLGVNMIQGAANSILGDVLQTAEGIAKEYISLSSYRKGTTFYLKNFGGIMGDVGRRDARNVVTRLMEKFNILDEPEDVNFSQRTKHRQARKWDTLYWTTHAGEHEMQGRFLLSMLADKMAYDKNGKELGSMLSQYSTNKETGELEISKEVDLEKSEWTEDDQFEFQYKVRGILSRLHGEYSDLGRVALQRAALGRMAFMFRKFVVPGFKRRWGGKHYIERLDDFVEGNYVTTWNFFVRMFKDLVHFKFDIGSKWGELSDHEKANIRRTLTEVSFVMMAIILSNVAIAKLKEDDDEDERFWSFTAYQALRLRAELLFFIKPDETLSILRSPMASMSVAENLIRLSGQIFHPLERYERGPWKDQLKIYKTVTNMSPGYRQFYRIRDLKEQLAWFSSKIN